jgi:ribosomal protein S18 acetylase RimI-like enzyme
MTESTGKYMNIEIIEKSWQDWKIFDKIQAFDGFKHTHYVYRDRIMANAKRKGLRFLVAYSLEKPVGFISFYFGSIPTLQFLSVIENYKNNGIEKMLLDKFVNEVKSRKMTRIRVYAEIGTGIEKMYEDLGFKKYGFTPSRYGKGRDASVMLLKL